MNYKVSIITVCYNEPELEKTCKSIVNQTFQEFEWIVIDGGSERKTLDIFEKYKKRINTFISEKDKGIYNAMNKGINLSNGDYLLFMNAGDCFFSNEVLEKAVKHLYKKDIVYGNVFYKQMDRIVIFPKKITKKFWITNCINHQCTFTAKKLFDKFGIYNEEYKIASDYEKLLEFIYKNKCSYKHIDEIIAEYNCLGVSSVNRTLLFEEKNKIIKKYFTKKEIDKANRPQGLISRLKGRFSKALKRLIGLC